MRVTRFFVIAALAAMAGCTDAPTGANLPSSGDLQQLQRTEQMENQRVAGEKAASAVAYDSLSVQYSLLGGLTQLTGGLLGTVTSTVDNVVGLLLCAPQPYDASVKVIGPEGGRISVGKHELVIPRGALTQRTVITAETPVGYAVTVRFSPHGLEFRRPAHLELDYSNCTRLPLLFNPRVAYTDERLTILDLLDSRENRSGDAVQANIDHFSRYAVAY
jgi:hypothetical protein